MAERTSTWKRNKLLTYRGKYFDLGGAVGGSASFNTPINITLPNDIRNVWKNPSGIDRLGAGLNNELSSTGTDIMQGLNGVSTALGVLSKGNKSLTANRATMQTPGNVAGLVGTGVDTLGQVLSTAGELTTKSRPSINKVIGLAYGGRLYDIGGIMGAAKTGTALIGNAFEQSKLDVNPEDVKQQVRESTMGLQPTNDTLDNLTNDYANARSLRHISAKDLRNKSLLSDIGNSLSASGQGFQAGSTFGPVGGIVGGVVGGLSSAIGSIFGRAKANKQAKRTNSIIDEVNAFNNRSLDNRAYNLLDTTAANLEATYAALGGALSTHGATFDNGLNYIGNGGSHEENPFEGVPMGVDPEGVPNLVEEGETIFNNYVFSKRLMVPKAIRQKYKLRGNKLSFADASMQMAKEAEERPNDPISKRGMQALLAELANTQEAIKMENQANQYAFGGEVNRFDMGTSNIRRKKETSGYKMAEAWSSTMGAALKKKLKEISNIKDFKERSKAMSAFAKEVKDIQDSYRNEVYDRNTWGNQNYVKGSKGHQDRFNKAGWNDLANFGSIFDYRNASTDIADTWVDNKIGDQTLLRMFGDLRYISKEDRDEISRMANNLGYSWDIGGDDNQLLYFNYNPALGHDDSEFNSVDPGPKPTYPVTTEDINGAKTAEVSSETPPNVRPTWMKYAPVVGAGIGALSSIFDRPDYSNANAILDVTNNATYQPIAFNPVGNYLRYQPFDRNYYINKQNAEAGATRRAIVQNSSMNRGTANAALLAADKGFINGIGDLAVKAEEYNLGQRQKTEEFNRATNMFNSEGIFKADAANQQALANLNNFKLQGTAQAMALRDAERNRVLNNRSTNLSNLFTSIGNIGSENEALNQRDFGIYTLGLNLDPDTAKLLPGGYNPPKKSRGGKIKRRKGFTI